MTITRRDLAPVGAPPAQPTLRREVKSYEAAPVSEPHVPDIVSSLPSEEPVEASEVATEQTEQTAEEKSAAQKRAEKRDALKEADKAYQRAMNMQKEAQEKLQKAEEFQKFMEAAKENPLVVAKALGVDPADFLRRYQNQIFNIKDEEPAPQATPEDEVKQTLEQYKKEREQERQQMEQTRSQLVRSNYIAQKILPILSKDPDKFELTHRANLESSANLIYDVMNEHYRNTYDPQTGKGEELSIEEVAEAYEAKLEEQMVAAVTKSKDIKKLAKFFVQEAKQLEEEQEETPPPARKSKTLSNNLGSKPAPTQPTKQSGYGHSREDRIRRVVEKFGK